jgi:hypothetical protein
MTYKPGLTYKPDTVTSHRRWPFSKVFCTRKCKIRLREPDPTLEGCASGRLRSPPSSHLNPSQNLQSSLQLLTPGGKSCISTVLGAPAHRHHCNTSNGNKRHVIQNSLQEEAIAGSSLEFEHFSSKNLGLPLMTGYQCLLLHEGIGTSKVSRVFCRILAFLPALE